MNNFISHRGVINTTFYNTTTNYAYPLCNASITTDCIYQHISSENSPQSQISATHPVAIILHILFIDIYNSEINQSPPGDIHGHIGYSQYPTVWTFKQLIQGQHIVRLCQPCWIYQVLSCQVRTDMDNMSYLYVHGSKNFMKHIIISDSCLKAVCQKLIIHHLIFQLI